MAETISTMSPQQKEVYFGKIEELLNNNNQLWKMVEKRGAEGGSAPAAGSSTAPTESRHFVVHTARNAGGGFIAPEGDYPYSGNQAYKRASYIGRTMHMSAAVSTLAIRNTSNDSAAYARALVESATKLGNDFSVRLERVLCGDGSGTLGVVSSVDAGAANSVTLKNPADARKFGVGDFIQAFASRKANATRRIWETGTNHNKIASINPTTGVLTMTTDITGNSTVAAADVLSLTYPIVASPSVTTDANFAAARTSTIRYEPQGIDSLVSDRDSPMETGTTYGGLYGILAPADYDGSANSGGVTQWASYVNRASTGRAYTDDILQTLLDMCEINIGMKPKIIVTSYGGRNEYAKSKQGIRRTVNSARIAGETSGGFAENTAAGSFLEYQDIPIIPSRFAPVDLDSNSQKTCSFIAINTDCLWIDEWHKPRFVDIDGLTWRMIGRTPFFEGIMEYQCEVVTDKRNAHAKATDILAADAV